MVRVLVVGDEPVALEALALGLRRTPGLRVDVVRSFDQVGVRHGHPGPGGDSHPDAADVVVFSAPALSTACLNACQALRRRLPELPILIATGPVPAALFTSVGALPPASPSIPWRDGNGPVNEAKSAQEFLARLTPVERRMLDLITVGLTNRQIAERLGLAHQTVKNYVSTIFTKLGVSRRAEAAARHARAEILAAAGPPALNRCRVMEPLPATPEELTALVAELCANLEQLERSVARLAGAQAAASAALAPAMTDSAYTSRSGRRSAAQPTGAVTAPHG